MATEFNETYRIEAPPERVCEVLRDPGFIDESERAGKALEVSVEEVSKTDSEHRYVIHTTTYARTVKGVDKSKTDKNRTDVTWSLGANSGRWDWKGPQGDKARVTGGYRLEPDGDGTRMILDARVEIRYPVVGKMVEKKVKDGFLKAWPHYAERARRWTQRAIDAVSEKDLILGPYRLAPSSEFTETLVDVDGRLPYFAGKGHELGATC